MFICTVYGLKLPDAGGLKNETNCFFLSAWVSAT